MKSAHRLDCRQHLARNIGAAGINRLCERGGCAVRSDAAPLTTHRGGATIIADGSITASGEVRLEARAQEPHAPPVEPPPVPVVVPDDQPNEPQEREDPEEPEPERRNRNRCRPLWTRANQSGWNFLSGGSLASRWSSSG